MTEYLSPLARPFEFPEGEHGVLLIHGFTGSPSHMLPLGEYLHHAGFGVRGILLPGHGTKMEDMRSVTWQDWLLACREAAEDMRKRYRSLTVAGLSMGGVLALLLAEEGKSDVCVPISAPMKTRNRFRVLAPAASLVMPTVHKRPDDPSAGLDPKYDINYASFPTYSTHHLNVLMRISRQHLSLISCPILAVQSRKDETVTKDSPDIILKNVSSREKGMLWLDEAPHVCTISPEYPRIGEAIRDFVR